MRHPLFGRLRRKHDRILESLEEYGELWGLKRTTVIQANAAVNQLVEVVRDLSDGDILLEARHDEVSLELSVVYTGPPLTIPESAPTLDQLGEADGVSRMAGWFMRNLADRATPFTRKGQQGVMLLFEL
jgi:hypothetical protein